jgi:hypothetical protein
MPPFQCRKLLAKSQVFEKQHATTVEELEDHTCQEYKRVNHLRVLSRFAFEWQCRILLKSQADRILARDKGKEPACRPTKKIAFGMITERGTTSRIPHPTSHIALFCQGAKVSYLVSQLS